MGSENLTYQERKALGFGTITERLGKETVKDYNHCALGLTVAKDAMVTPDGVIYEREHILRNIIKQKKDILRTKTSMERQVEGDCLSEIEMKEREREREIKRFHMQNHGAGAYQEQRDLVVDDEALGVGGGGGARRVEFGSRFDKERAENMNEFWANSVNVDKVQNRVKMVEKETLFTKCPQTGKKLRMKDLIEVKWTKSRDDEDVYICPVTMKTFTNTTPIVILKPTGEAVSLEAYDRVIKKEGSYNGKKINPKKDIIRLERGGTGFAASGTQVESKIDKIMGQGSGLSEVRGQNKSAASRFALRM
jgi:nitric oxide synthase-interacting protein